MCVGCDRPRELLKGDNTVGWKCVDDCDFLTTITDPNACGS